MPYSIENDLPWFCTCFSDPRSQTETVSGNKQLPWLHSGPNHKYHSFVGRFCFSCCFSRPKILQKRSQHKYGGQILINLYKMGVPKRIYIYNGNRFPKFSIWPGKLFLNYSFIKMGKSGVSSTGILTSIAIHLCSINSPIYYHRKKGTH